MSQSPPEAERGGTRAEVLAWAMYDWANSAFSTILITIVHGYLTGVVFEKGDPWGPTWYAWGISASMVVAACLSPVVGALADVNRSKRRWLAATALLGAGGAVAMAAVPPDNAVAVVVLLMATSLCFQLSLGVYNAFLPEIAREDRMNAVSAWGFALGYLGGAIALILAMVVLQVGPSLGVPDVAGRLRIGILIMGLWWGLFSIPTLWVLRDRGQAPALREPMLAAAILAFRDVGRTLAGIRRYRILALFLLGFLFYNQGVQAVLSQSSTFAREELQFETAELAHLILMIQFLALPGAVLVGRLSDRLGQKPTLLACLAVWVTLLLAAFFLVTAKWQFWILGGVVAMVMGGTQSVSRAIMGTMTPPRRTGEFFGFFNFSGKATDFMGTFLFGLTILLTRSARWAILSLLVFFLIGWALAARINVAEGRRQALAEG